MKPVGEPDAGNPHVRFDERGGETGRCRMAQVTAPFLDSTILCGNYEVANEQSIELVSLADERSAPHRKAWGILLQGCLVGLDRQALNAVHTISAGIAAMGSTGTTLWIPWHVSFLATAYAELGQFDDAWRCIGEAMTAVETTKERWWEAEVYRIAGEIALKSPEWDISKAEA
jgi:hypothetical protein